MTTCHQRGYFIFLSHLWEAHICAPAWPLLTAHALPAPPTQPVSWVTAPTGPGRPHTACSTSSWHLPRWLPAQLFCVPKDTNGTPAGPGLTSDKEPTLRAETQTSAGSTFHVVLSKHNTPCKPGLTKSLVCPQRWYESPHQGRDQTILILLRSSCRPRTRRSFPSTPCTHTHTHAWFCSMPSFHQPRRHTDLLLICGQEPNAPANAQLSWYCHRALPPWT